MPVFATDSSGRRYYTLPDFETRPVPGGVQLVRQDWYRYGDGDKDYDTTALETYPTQAEADAAMAAAIETARAESEARQQAEREQGEARHRAWLEQISRKRGPLHGAT